MIYCRCVRLSVGGRHEVERWICVSKKIMECKWLDEKPVSRREAWLDMLFMAGWKDRKIDRGGKKEICPRGSFPASLASLSQRWGWSEKRVLKFLKMTEAQNAVKVVRGTQRKCSIITILNYEEYQSLPHQVGSEKCSVSGSVKVSQQYCNITTTTLADLEKKPPQDETYSQLVWAFNPTERHLKSWRTAYPRVDIDSQLSKAKAWLISNQHKRKKDLPRFFNYWLKKAEENVIETKDKTEPRRISTDAARIFNQKP